MNVNDIKEFELFYERLENKKNLIYMYFSKGLLHYAIESCALVPSTVNLVLITSCLSKEEVDVIDKIIKRPHINFPNYCHDGEIWNLITEKAMGDFGWLDVDCFILNQRIFDEITQFSENSGINTLWVKSYDCYCMDRLFSNTYFQFFRYEVLRKVKEKYGYVNMLPVVFDDEKEDIPYEKYYVCPDEERKRLFLLYPELAGDEKGLDTTHYYQLFMFAEGYSTRRVRDLSQMKQYYSEEALHLGGCHMIHRIKLDNTLRRIYYRFNMRYSYYLLLKYLNVLPETYQNLRVEFERNLLENRLSYELQDIERLVQEYADRNGLPNLIKMETKE